jgi:uncharacterized repeat protein (TIGR03803 family)
VVGPNGDIYGVTRYGGGGQGSGLVYRLNPSNHQVQTVHKFSSTGQSSPYRFLLGKDGNFYGVATSAQGDLIFQMTPTGTVTTLYTPPNFPITLTLMQANDGSGGLTLGADNNLYGATAQGGAYGVRPGSFGYGTLFKLSP